MVPLDIWTCLHLILPCFTIEYFSTLDSSLLYFFFLILKLIRWPLFQHLSSTRKFLTVCFDLIKMMLFFTIFLHLNTKVFNHNTKILQWFCNILLHKDKLLKRIVNLLRWFSIIRWKCRKILRIVAKLLYLFCVQFVQQNIS